MSWPEGQLIVICAGMSSSTMDQKGQFPGLGSSIRRVAPRGTIDVT